MILKICADPSMATHISLLVSAHGQWSKPCSGEGRAAGVVPRSKAVEVRTGLIGRQRVSLGGGRGLALEAMGGGARTVGWKDR